MDKLSDLGRTEPSVEGKSWDWDPKKQGVGRGNEVQQGVGQEVLDGAQELFKGLWKPFCIWWLPCSMQLDLLFCWKDELINRKHIHGNKRWHQLEHLVFWHCPSRRCAKPYLCWLILFSYKVDTLIFLFLQTKNLRLRDVEATSPRLHSTVAGELVCGYSVWTP